MVEPTIVKKLAIDVTPNHHAIWCTSEERPQPFLNTIVRRKFSADYSRIHFMLDTHNFFSADPDELVDVVEQVPTMHQELLERLDAEDAKLMNWRPLTIWDHLRG